MDSIACFMVSYQHQHIIFYPFVMAARWNLYVQGILTRYKGASSSSSLNTTLRTTSTAS
jgi:hypothetical protein